MAYDLITNGESGESVRTKLNAMAARRSFTILDVAIGNYPTGPGRVKPSVWVPKSGRIYVSGTSPSILPAGNDTTGDGSRATPYATITKALTVVPAGGDYMILVDGTISENNSGRFILAGVFTLPVVVASITGLPADCIITNASGTNGVLNVRSASAQNIQFLNITIQPSTDGCVTIFHNPSGVVTSKNIRFFGCVIAQRSHSGSNYAIKFDTDYVSSGWYFVDCVFRRDAGASTTFNPLIAATANQTQTIDNQPVTDLLFWGCRTSSSQWFDFGGVSGVNGLIIAHCKIEIGSGQHAILVGSDTSGDNNPKVTLGYVGMNVVSCASSLAHGILIGSNVNGAVVEGNFVTSSLQGIVAKGATNYFIRNNYVELTAAGTGAALYSKASTYGYWYNNVAKVANSTGATISYAWREDQDSSSGVKSGNNTFIGNYLRCTGSSAAAVYWGPSSASTGGAVSDFNVIELASSAALGVIRSTTVTTLAGLKAAWASSGLAGDGAANDNATTLDPVSGFISITTTAASAIYMIVTDGFGRQFDGIEVRNEPAETYARSALRLLEASSGAYKRPAPTGLYAGSWRISYRILVGLTPNANDPEVAFEQYTVAA